MSSQAGLIIKILLLSIALSLLIKYGGRYLSLEATTTTALTVVLLPSMIIGLILGWRYSKL
jgi:hypothetical protein